MLKPGTLLSYNADYWGPTIYLSSLDGQDDMGAAEFPQGAKALVVKHSHNSYGLNDIRLMHLPGGEYSLWFVDDVFSKIWEVIQEPDDASDD